MIMTKIIKFQTHRNGQEIALHQRMAGNVFISSFPNAKYQKQDSNFISIFFCSRSLSTEAQQKRYKNNDILSSLSSSILMSTPKRSALNVDSTPTPTKAIHLDHELTKNSNEKNNSENSSGKQRPSQSSRVGTSNSDLPLHRPTEQIKPVIKSMSDGYVPRPDTPKAPKLTLFNRDYSNIPAASDRKRSIDDEDEYSVSFVKPKAKTSTLFSGNKNRDQKSKLQMMLSFLRGGDESKDEVDSVQSSKNNADKTDDKNSAKATVSSTPANLTTITSVTFSTATTTSVLNVPSDAANSKTSTIEPPKEQGQNSNEVSKTVESKPTPIIALTTSTSLPLSTIATTAASLSENPQPSIAITTKPASVTFSLPSALTTQSQPVPSTTSATTTNESVPRLGGFSFPGTAATFTSPLTAKPTATENAPAPKSEENKIATPTFSFGLAKSTSGSTLPAYAPPTFGAKTESSTPIQSSNIQTTSAPVTFNFGSPATKPPTMTTSANVSFGTPSSAAPNPLGAGTPSMFAFGATAKTTTPSAPTVTSINTTSAGSMPFAFGSNAPSAAAPTFGFGNTSTNVTTAAGSTPLNQKTPAFSFGSATNATKPGKPQKTSSLPLNILRKLFTSRKIHSWIYIFRYECLPIWKQCNECYNIINDIWIGRCYQCTTNWSIWSWEYDQCKYHNTERLFIRGK